MSQRQKRASLAGLLVVVIASVLIFGITLSTRGPSQSASAQQAREPKPLRGVDVAGMLYRIGCNPEAMAAVGFSAASLPSLLAVAGDHLQSKYALIEEAEALCVDTRRSEHALTRLIQRGKGTPEDVAALRQTKSLIPQVDAERYALLDGLKTAVASHFTATQMAQLERIHANSGQGVSAKYLLVDRSDEDWATLRDALAMERISAEWNEPIPEEFRIALAVARIQPDTQAAGTNLTLHADQMESSYEAAIDGWGG